MGQSDTEHVQHMLNIKRKDAEIERLQGLYDIAVDDRVRMYEKLETLQLEYRITLEALHTCRAALIERDAQIERQDELIQTISAWVKAYPLPVFPEPKWQDVRKALGDTLLTRVSASNMRHVVAGIERIIFEWETQS